MTMAMVMGSTLTILVLLISAVEAGSNSSTEGVYSELLAGGRCTRKVGECNVEETEWVVDSEITRRLLRRKDRYISGIAVRNSGSSVLKSKRTHSYTCAGTYRCKPHH